MPFVMIEAGDIRSAEPADRFVKLAPDPASAGDKRRIPAVAIRESDQPPFDAGFA